MPKHPAGSVTPATSVSDQSDPGGGDEEMPEERREYTDEERLFVEVTEDGMAFSGSRSLEDYVSEWPERRKELIEELYQTNILKEDSLPLKQRENTTGWLTERGAREGHPIERITANDVKSLAVDPPKEWRESGVEELENVLGNNITIDPKKVQGTAFGWEYASFLPGDTGREGCTGYMRKIDADSGVETRYEPEVVPTLDRDRI